MHFSSVMWGGSSSRPAGMSAFPSAAPLEYQMCLEATSTACRSSSTIQSLFSNASMKVFLSVVPLRAAAFASSQQGPWRGSNGDLFEIVFLRNALVASLVVADPILRRPVPCRHSPGDPEHVAGLERHAYCPFQSDRLPNGEAMNVHCWILLLARCACSASSRSAPSSSEWSIPTSWLLRRSVEEMAGR